MHGEHDFVNALIGDQTPVCQIICGVEVIDRDDYDIYGTGKIMRILFCDVLVLVGTVIVGERGIDGCLHGKADEQIGDGDKGGDRR